MDQSPLLLITIAGMIINQLYNINREIWLIQEILKNKSHSPRSTQCNEKPSKCQISFITKLIKIKKENKRKNKN